MARSAWGAFIGFVVTLIGGIVIVFMIVQNVITGIVDEHGAMIILFGSLFIIPLLSILGAIIGYFFGNNFYESLTKLTESSSGVGGDTKVMLQVIFGVIGGVLLISGFILTFVDVGQSGFVLNFDAQTFHLNPLSITFLVIGVILLVIVIGVATRGNCLDGCF